MAEEEFRIKAVDEQFDVASGLVMLTAESGTAIPLDIEAYRQSLQSVAAALGVPVDQVSLVDCHVRLNDEGFFDLVQ